MKQIGFYLIAFFYCVSSFQAQIALPNVLRLDTMSYQFGINASQDIQSSSLRNEFTRYFIRGGHIPDDLIQKTFDAQKDINRIGRLLQGNIFYVDFKHSPLKRYGIMAELGYNSIASGIYGKNSFGLAFLGNNQFIGDTVQLSGTGFEYIDFQNVGLGLMDKKTKSYLTLNFISVQNYVSGDINSGYIHFAADSTNIEIASKGSGNYTNAQFFNGFGASLNLCYNVELPWLNEKVAYYQFIIKNLGFAQTKPLNTLQVDTTINYQGFQIENFINESVTNINVLDTLHIQKSQKKKSLVLPTEIHLSKILNANYEGRFQSLFGIIIFPTIHFIPKVYAGVDVKITPNFHLGNTYSIGGFGNFRGGLYANYTQNKINFGIGSEDIYGLISKRGFGQMLTFRMLCTL